MDRHAARGARTQTHEHALLMSSHICQQRADMGPSRGASARWGHLATHIWLVAHISH